MLSAATATCRRFLLRPYSLGTEPSLYKFGPRILMLISCYRDLSLISLVLNQSFRFKPSHLLLNPRLNPSLNYCSKLAIHVSSSQCFKTVANKVHPISVLISYFSFLSFKGKIWHQVTEREGSIFHVFGFSPHCSAFSSLAQKHMITHI